MVDNDGIPTIDEALPDGGASPPVAAAAPTSPPSAVTGDRKWGAPTVSAVVAACGVTVAVIAFIIQSNLTRDQLRQANELGWSYQGAQQCVNYRSEVLKLWDLGLGAEQIKSWLALEKGGPLYDNPGDRTAYEDRADGCGKVEDLLALLPKTPPSPVTGS